MQFGVKIGTITHELVIFIDYKAQAYNTGFVSDSEHKIAISQHLCFVELIIFVVLLQIVNQCEINMSRIVDAKLYGKDLLQIIDSKLCLEFLLFETLVY